MLNNQYYEYNTINQKEAEYNLNRYFEVCLQIFEENEEEAKDLLKRFQYSRKSEKSSANKSTTTF